jgi:hypothetical protein
MKTILSCGDSYSAPDDKYPGLHWSEKLQPHTCYSIARGGASNFSIWHQVQQCAKFKPDVVLISFTSCPRIEFPKTKFKNLLFADNKLGLMDIKYDYCNTMHANIDHGLPGYNTNEFANWLPYYIEEYEVLKNFLYIKASLDFLKVNNIEYYYTLGGFSSKVGLVSGIPVQFDEHSQFEKLPNGWLHPIKLMSPSFHIPDEQWHNDHAELVKSLL